MSDLSARADVSGDSRLQHRSAPLVDYEFRAEDDSPTWTFEGIASTVDHPYQVRDWLGEYTEIIAKGAFDRSIADTDAKISLHINHGYGRDQPLAMRGPGVSTLVVSADPHLRLKAELDSTRADVQTLRSTLKRGEMSEMSIGFNSVKDGATWNDDFTERTVTDMRLREGSIVEDGANDLTSASMRSLILETARFNCADVDEGEILRAIQFLTGLLPNEIPDPVEIEARSGLVVTDEFIQLWAKRHSLA